MNKHGKTLVRDICIKRIKIFTCVPFDLNYFYDRCNAKDLIQYIYTYNENTRIDQLKIMLIMIEHLGAINQNYSYKTNCYSLIRPGLPRNMMLNTSQLRVNRLPNLFVSSSILPFLCDFVIFRKLPTT